MTTTRRTGPARMRRIVLAATSLALCGGVGARAEESAVRFTKLFTDTCLAKFGHLDAIDDWANAMKLPPIMNPEALAVFAGRPNRDGKMLSFAGGGVPGSGKAWAVSEPAGHFVLATRLDPESCVAWAQKADPLEVEAAFAKMVSSASTPGAGVKLVEDKTINVPIGQVHIRVYRVWSGSPMNSLALAMATVNHAGGPFQAMLETQRVFDPEDAINPMVPVEPPSRE